MDAPDRRLTREEFLAGLVRLAVVLVLLFAVGVAIGLLLASSGNGDTRSGIANGLTLVGACILVFAVGSWLHTGPLRREGMRPRLAAEEERRDSERLALGLVGIGVLLFVVALLLA
jgi:hypothetical protein